MRFLANVSIKRKQMLIIMLTSSVALLLACIAFVTYEWHTFRQEMKRNLLKVTARMAEKNSGAFAYEDKSSANRVLNAICSQEPSIVVAIAYRRNGKVLAHYRRADQIGIFNLPAPPKDLGFDFSLSRLTLGQHVMSNKELIGSVFIESDLGAMYDRLFRYGGIMLFVLCLSSVVAFVFSSRLQSVISEPIIHLAGVAKIVSHKKNYAVRAEKYNVEAGDDNDELNALIDGFNEMLAQIQQRDGDLQKARDELEQRVEARTRDLQLEIAERVRAEKSLQQQFARISLLNQITHSIAERMDLRSVLNIVLKQLEDHLPVSFGAVLVRNSENRFVLTAMRSQQKLPLEAEFRLALHSAMAIEQTGFEQCTQRHTVVIPDTSQANAPLLCLLARSQLNAAIAVPMLVEETLFGILFVARTQASSFTEQECEFLRMLSEQVALAAHQARLHTELQTAYNELRQTQQTVMQQQRLQALGQMASGIAHDVNNALSPVIVYSELMLRNEPKLSDSSRRHLNNIKTAGEDIAHIVTRMREFYRRREENEQLTLINLNQLCEQVMELTRPRWRDIPQQKGLVIDMQTDLDVTAPEIYASPSELREAVTNLILNAVDAMPNGGRLTIQTRLSAASDSHSRGHVCLEVRDTGVGMDEETRRRCLEPFFSTKGQRGTGLGLAMVYGIMERHEGRIEVDSAPGKGTTMRLIFPVRDLSDIEEETKFFHLNTANPMRILCIDDEPLLRQMLKEILETDGHKVEVADGGQAGIDAFRQAHATGAADRFDVVITDLGMPYVDGRTVACTLKKESPGTPVILLTGWGSMMKADGEVPAQVDAVLSKPPRISELRETLLKISHSLS